MLSKGIVWYLQGFVVWFSSGLVWAGSLLLLLAAAVLVYLIGTGNLPWYGWLTLGIIGLINLASLIVKIRNENKTS